MEAYSEVTSTRRMRCLVLALGLACASQAGLAQAQSQPEPLTQPPEGTEPAAAAPASGPAPAESPIAEPAPEPPAPALPAPPPPPPGTMPPSIPDGMSPPGPVAPAFPPALPSLDYGARMRMAARFQDQNKPKTFGDTAMQIDADLYMGGALTRYLKWQAGVTISYSGAVPTAANAATAAAPYVLPLDVLAKFEPIPEFNIYMGRMIVVADRYTPSGPWGMDEFFYPGVFTGSFTATHPAAALQKSSTTGRDLGFNIWGALMGGTVKYYLGSYQFHDPSVSPLWSGRLQVSLLSPEPGFYQRTTYYGTKDLLSFGVGGQYQKKGSVTTMSVPATMMGGMPTTVPVTDDYAYFTADVNFEKRLGDAGTLSIYGAYNQWFADNKAWKNFFHASVGWTFPQIVGIGKFRPDIRFQQGTVNADGADASRIIDVQLSYVMMDWFARVNIGYRNLSTYNSATKTSDTGNMLWFGLLYADP